MTPLEEYWDELEAAWFGVLDALAMQDVDALREQLTEFLKLLDKPVHQR